MSFDFFLALCGLFVLLWRTQPWRTRSPLQLRTQNSAALPSVAVIIPCRNEEANIGHLLETLKNLKGIRPEVIVVDDDSLDNTHAVATSTGCATVIKAPPKPEGWVGKSWACWQGAIAAQSKLLLFTDADTRHTPDSLLKAIQFLIQEKADLISGPPYHLCKNPFERFLGLFHIMPLIASAQLGRPKSRRLYAIGQYLLIRKEAYFKTGGHEALRNSLVEDMHMARRIMTSGLTYAVYPDTDLYQVQMYRTLREFMSGWKRLLRLGSKEVSLGSFIEVVLIFYLFFQVSFLTLIAFVCLAWTQRRHGRFYTWGAILAHLSLIVFTVLSVLGAIETIFKRKVTWHGRVYVDS